MAKIKLLAEPTFKANVAIPVPGAEPAEVGFTFKHRTADELLKWVDACKDKKDAESIAGMVVGWDFDDELNKKNIERLCQNYMGAAKAIFSTYFDELGGQRTKN